ncbi:MAG: FISUMP domain-containing protein [Bacteroidota bacterium]
MLTAIKAGYDSYSTTFLLVDGLNVRDIEMTSSQFTHIVSGTVVSATTQQPLQGVGVTILNDDGTPSQLRSSSDFGGYYQVPTVPQGLRRLQFVKPNYQTVTVEVFLSSANLRYDCEMTYVFCPPTVSHGGKVYPTVQVNDQCWLKENLDVGTMIQSSQPQSDNGVIEKYCYDNNPSNCTTYGGLYLWSEAMQYTIASGTQGICPPGWRIPTLVDFQALQTFVSSDGNRLKRQDQGTGNGQGTNTTGFSALLAGNCSGYGVFGYLGTDAFFSSSTPAPPSGHFNFKLHNNSPYIALDPTVVTLKSSIRCIQD